VNKKERDQWAAWAEEPKSLAERWAVWAAMTAETEEWIIKHGHAGRLVPGAMSELVIRAAPLAVCERVSPHVKSWRLLRT
jgi:RES domain-containing protein